MVWDLKFMSKNQVKNIGVECPGCGDSNSEVPSTAPYDNKCYTAPECLPSWREFTEGIPIFSQTCGYCISMSLERSKFKSHPKVSVEPARNFFESNSYLPFASRSLSQQVSRQLYQIPSTVFPNNLAALPLVEVAHLTGVSNKLPSGYQIAQQCNTPGRRPSCDLPRHIRTHDRVARFKCFYPRACCPHHRGYFHRRYDLKKHLLHHHFILSDRNVKRFKNLTDKLEYEGTCPCGERMKAREWLVHIISRDAEGDLECKDLRKKTAENTEPNTAESRI
jgi:hypothetical protein